MWENTPTTIYLLIFNMEALFKWTEIEPNPKLSPLLSSILGYETVRVFMGWDPKQPLRGVDFIKKKKLEWSLSGEAGPGYWPWNTKGQWQTAAQCDRCFFSCCLYKLSSSFYIPISLPSFLSFSRLPFSVFLFFRSTRGDAIGTQLSSLVMTVIIF
jgi:hypothetical protein